MYNTHTLKATLTKLTEIFRKEPHIEGVVLVGSGAKGFPDDYADIDVVVVVDQAAKTREIYEDLVKKLKLSFEVYRYQHTEVGENSYLAQILLHDFLEIDLGVISLEMLTAKKEEWKILFEKTDRVEKKLAASWHARKTPDAKKAVAVSINASWIHLKNGLFALKRKQTFRVLKEIEELRNEVVEIWAAYEDKVAKNFRDVDKLRNDFRRKLEETFLVGPDYGGLRKAFVNIFNLYFWVAKEIDGSEAVLEFEKKMRILLREVHLDESGE